MKSLVLYNEESCCEYSPTTPFSELPRAQKTILVDSPPRHFSTIGIQPIRIGNLPNSHITLSDTTATFTITSETETLQTATHPTIPPTLTVLDPSNLYLNGKKVAQGEHNITPGDSLWAGTTNLVIHQTYISCIGENYTTTLNISTHTPEKYAEYPIYKRSPRIIKRQPTETVELTAPKDKQETKKGELARIILPPLAMMAVTIGMGIMLGRGLFVFASAAMMMVSAVFSITRFISDSKDKKTNEQERINNYDKYLLTQRKKIYTLHQTQQESLQYHNLSPKDIEHEVLTYSSRLYERAASDSDFLTLSLGYSTIPTSYQLKLPTSTGETTKDPLVTEMQEIAGAYQNVKNMPTVIDLKQAHLGLVGEKTYIHRQISSILTQLSFFQSYLDIEIILLVEDTYWHKFAWARWLPHCKVKNINITGLVSAENQRDQVLGNITQVLKTRKQTQSEQKQDSRFLPHYLFIIDNPKLIINHSIMEYLQTPTTSLGFSLIYTTNIQANLPENIQTVFILDGGDKGTLLMKVGILQNRTVTLPTTDIDFETIARMLAPIKHNQGVSTQIPESVTFFELYNVKHPDEIPVADLWHRNASHKTLAVPLGLRGKDDIVYLNLHEKAHGPHGLVAGTTGSGKSEIVQSYILSLAVNFHPHEVGFLLIDYKGGGMANLFANLPHLLGTITNLDGSESMRALASIKSELARRQRMFGVTNVNHINQYTKLFKAGEVTVPMPHLFIISDEFAELKKEQPDFMTELVSTARIGRSLGVHLILATQKPTGVVDDQIWSNSKFKLALKVADESDSNEILKTPDAARITQPGRAYLQVGNNEIYELFQSAYSGAPFSADIVKKGFDSRVYLLNPLGQGELLNDDLSVVDAIEESDVTQLDVVVRHINTVYEELQAASPTPTTITDSFGRSITVARPWLPPLEQKLVTPHIPHISQCVDVGSITTHNLTVPIAMADIPEEQLQTEYTHNFIEDGNFAVFGASGFGKSTTMMNMALTLAANNSPQLLNFFVMDYGNSALAQLRGLPHTADYLTIDDDDKLEKLVKLLSETLKKRKSQFAAVSAINFRMYNDLASEGQNEGQKRELATASEGQKRECSLATATPQLPAIVLFIDNYDVVKEVNPGLEEFLVKLTRDGTGVGVYTVITASRTNAVRYTVLNNFKNKLALFMFEESDITAVVGRCGYKLTDVRGRAIVKMKQTHIAQCYLPVVYDNDVEYIKEVGALITNISERNTGTKAAGVRVVSDVVTMEDLIPYANAAEHKIVLGFNTDTTEPVYLDLGVTCLLVVGNAGTGKTNLLRVIARQLQDQALFVADSPAGDLNQLESWTNVTYMETAAQLDGFYDRLNAEVVRRKAVRAVTGGRLRDFFESQPPVLVLIDDGDYFVELCKNRYLDMENLIKAAKSMGIVFILTTRTGKLTTFDNMSKLLIDNQAGIVLGNPGQQGILGVNVPRDYKAVVDIGFFSKQGDICKIKLPLISSLRA